MTPSVWVSIAGLFLTVLTMGGGCLVLLVKITWQASAILSRLDTLEKAGNERDERIVRIESFCRASRCGGQFSPAE
jgi:hypothetical protein